MAFISVFPGFTPESGFGLTGNIGDGNSVTITGSGFGTKPNGAKPWLFFEIGKGVLDIDPRSRGTWTTDWSTRTSLEQTVVAPNRTHSLEFQLSQVGGSSAINASGFDMNAGSIKDDTYAFLRIHNNFDGIDLFAGQPSYNIKGMRFWFVVGANNVIAPLYGQQNDSDGNPRMSNTTGPTLFFDNLGAAEEAVFGFRKNEWITDEWELHQGAVDTDEATLKVSRNGYPNVQSPGGTIGDPAAGTFISRDTADPNLYNLFFLYQDQNTTPGPSFDAFMRVDLFYLEDSICHIILSNEPTWEAATASPEVFYEREPQIPTAWADDEVTFTMRRGVHSDFGGKYIYITDSAGTTQKTGQIN